MDGTGPARRPDPAPLEGDDVRVVAVGTGLFAVAGLVLLLFREDLADAGRGWWLGVCAWGVGLGLVGLRHCVRRRAAIGRAQDGQLDAHSR